MENKKQYTRKNIPGNKKLFKINRNKRKKELRNNRNERGDIVPYLAEIKKGVILNTFGNLNTNRIFDMKKSFLSF